jgi:gluconolactonase
MSTDIEALTTAFSEHLEGAGSLEIVAEGFRFLEGPVWDAKEGRLFFSDIKGNAIYKWFPESGVRFFRENSFLANGNTLDHQGRLVTCEHGTSRLTRTDREGRYEVLAASFQGKALNSPNDVIVRSDGLVLFTDPSSGRSESYGIPRPQELDFQGVYAVDPAGGEPVLLVGDFEFPNGLCLSPDERFLYINDTRRAHIRVFPVSAPGKPGEAAPARLGPGKVFAEMPLDLPGFADGMKFDSSGLLFCTGPGGILVFDTKGGVVGRIYVPEQTANFAWGGPDYRTLFIAASTRLYAIRLGVPGLPAPPL